MVYHKYTPIGYIKNTPVCHCEEQGDVAISGDGYTFPVCHCEKQGDAAISGDGMKTTRTIYNIKRKISKWTTINNARHVARAVRIKSTLPEAKSSSNLSIHGSTASLGNLAA